MDDLTNVDKEDIVFPLSIASFLRQKQIIVIVGIQSNGGGRRSSKWCPIYPGWLFSDTSDIFLLKRNSLYFYETEYLASRASPIDYNKT